MLQNFFKRSAAVKIGIPRKGSKTNKSLSPVTMHEAFASTANSRNLLSLGSWQPVMISAMGKKTALKEIVCITLYFSSSFKKYLSNFFLNNTSTNSSMVAFEKASFPNITALSIAPAVIVPAIREALTKLFVSNTKSLFIFQNFLKNIFCKAALLHRTAKLLQILNEIFFGIGKFFCQCNIYLLRNFVSAFLRRQSPFFCSRFIHFNYYSFHDILFYRFSNLKKIRNTA